MDRDMENTKELFQYVMENADSIQQAFADKQADNQERFDSERDGHHHPQPGCCCPCMIKMYIMYANIYNAACPEMHHKPNHGANGGRP